MNNKQRILPIIKMPFKLTNQFTSLHIAMLGAFESNYKTFLCNNFFNIIMTPDEKRLKYDLINVDTWFTKSKSFTKELLRFDTDIKSFKSINIIDFIKERITNNQYILAKFDPFYIPSNIAYMTMHLYQYYLIYGYNDAKQVFYILTENSKSHDEVHYDNYLNSIFKRMDGFFTLNTICPVPNYIPTLNLKTIYNGIYDYLNSSNQYEDIFKDASKSYIYGINSYINFCSRLKDIYDYYLYINPHEISVFIQHHRLNKIRFDYLLEQGILNEDLICKHNELLRLAELTYNNCLEYNKSIDFKMLGVIQDSLNHIIKTEEEVLSITLKHIGNTVSV